MTFTLSERDHARLATCHPHLQTVFERAQSRTRYPFMIVWGWRNEAQQNGMAAKGVSEKHWPNSLHNALDAKGKPASRAVDFAPIFNGVIPWGDSHIFAAVYGSIHAAATEVGVQLRWGGDWNGDGSTKDQKLKDWGHVELAGL